MSAFFTSPACPILSFADATALRAEPSPLLRTGSFGNIDGATDLVRYDSTETAADDGVDYWIPDDVDPGDPGRWVLFPVGGGGTPDFAAPVLHVNVGGTVPSTGLYGLSVDYTAGANRRGIFWDPTNTTWAFAQDTLGDDTTIASYLDARANAFKAKSFVSDGTGGVDFMALQSGDEIKARVGTPFRVFAALAGPTFAYGDTTVGTVTLDAATLLRVTSQLAAELRASTTLSVKDPTGGTTLLIASVAGSYLDVFGRLRAKNGGTTVLDVDVGSSQADVNAKLNVNDPTGVANYFNVSSGIATALGSFLVKNAAGTATILTVAGASALAQVNGEFVVKDATGATTLLDATPGSTTVAVTGSLTASTSVLSPLFDTASAVPMTIGTTATKVTVKALATAGNGLTVQVDGVTTTSGGGGLSVANTTDTTSPAASVQRSPPISWKARARVSSVDTGFVVDSQLIPTTGGNWQLLLRKSTDSGGTYSEIGRLTNSSPGQFIDGLYMASGFLAGTGTNGFMFDTDGSGLNRGGSGDLQVLARAASIAMLLRSPVTASVAGFRLYSSGDTRGASKIIAEFGDVAAGFTQRSAIMGDGTYNGPAWVEVAAQTANYTAAARQRVALTSTGGAFDFTLPTAVGCAGQQIKAYMTAASANVVTLKTTSAQTISGSASGALTLGNAVSIETALFTSDDANWWFERSSTVL